MTMRIVDVCAFYAPSGGGVKTYLDRKLKAAASGTAEVVALVPGPANSVQRVSPAASIVSIASPTLPFDRRYRYFADEVALHAALDWLAPDVVEVSSPWTSPSMVARWPGTAVRSLVMHADPLSAYAYRWFGPLVARERIDRGFDWFWRHLRRLDRRFDAVVCASPSLAARLTSGGLRRAVTVPMGVEPATFSPSLRDEELRARLLDRCGLPADATLLVGAGRLAPEKRWPMVIEAVTAAGYGRPVGLVLLGDGRDRARVARAARQAPHVHLAAPIADRAAFATVLASADALVHGCEAETFCMVAAEARASGLPILVPAEGGAGDQFAQGRGALFRPRDGEALAAAIAALDVGASRSRAVAAASTVTDMDRHFEDLFGLYRRMLSRDAVAA